MNVRELGRVYFIGIGGIGMSALARFFRERGVTVNGYDKTETELTRKLVAEGMGVHYTDEVHLVDKDAELVVYTPAIPRDHSQLNWYRDHGYPVYKRSDVLQWITSYMHAVTIAGTHGKTTISTMVGYLLREAGKGCNAFLGGISVNYDTNYWSSRREIAVVEADEYDRSFLKLFPDLAVLTSTDPDHLDIYGTSEAMEAAYVAYTRNIKPGGTLLVKYGLHQSELLTGPTTFTYSLNNQESVFHAKDIECVQGGYVFTLQGNGWELKDVALNVGGMHNVENAVAAIAVASLLGTDLEKVKQAMPGFKGVKRRFEYLLRTDQVVYIDDYAHHPQEIAALIRGARQLFPGRKMVVCFQPHLFSRTRDLVEGFAHSLDQADQVILLDIYPAREKPIAGVTSAMIAEQMKNPDCTVMTREELLRYLGTHSQELFITAGAGDIDQLTGTIKQILEKQNG